MVAARPMPPEEFLRELRARGVAIWRSGAKLKTRGTVGRKAGAYIQQHKAALLRLLIAEENAAKEALSVRTETLAAALQEEEAGDPDTLADPFAADPQNPDLVYLHAMLESYRMRILPPGPAITAAGTFADPGAALWETWDQAWTIKQRGDLEGAISLGATLCALVDWWNAARREIYDPKRHGRSVENARRRMKELHPPGNVKNLIANLNAAEGEPTAIPVA